MTSNERLIKAIEKLKEEQGLTNDLLSLALGYRSKNYVSDIVGGNKPANRLFLQKLQERYGISQHYIETGKGQDRIFDKPVSSEDQPVTTYQHKRLAQKNHPAPYMVPLVPVTAQAGYARSYENSDYIRGLEEYPIVPGVDPRGAVWRYFQVEGDSMLELLNDGDYVLASQVPKEDWPDLKDFYMYVVVTDDLVTIKHLVKRKGGQELVLIPRNDKFPQQALKLENVREIWRYRRHIGWNASPVKKFEIKI